MTKKRSTDWPGFYNPFSFYAELFNSSLQISELLQSSSEVIMHRSQMMAEATQSGTPAHNNEFITMWAEKVTAYNEACFAMARHALKNPLNPDALTLNEKNIKSHFKGLQAVIKPYHSKSKANAARLRKKR